MPPAAEVDEPALGEENGDDLASMEAQQQPLPLPMEGGSGAGKERQPLRITTRSQLEANFRLPPPENTAKEESASKGPEPPAPAARSDEENLINEAKTTVETILSSDGTPVSGIQQAIPVTQGATDNNSQPNSGKSPLENNGPHIPWYKRWRGRGN
ncbi:hypothetical protein MKEN_00223200 [Mycena kentingensis (nom. inval.)]|nr:hypothetical protein MKEN_00223200 [Mycena kentingensis (nom. inval.)]